MLNKVVTGIIALLEQMGSSHEKDVSRGDKEPTHVLSDEFFGKVPRERKVSRADHY